MPWEKAIDDIYYVRSLGREMSGPDRVRRQHDRGYYTIRERIDKIVDPGTFVEQGPMIRAAEFDDQGNIADFSPSAYVMGIAEIDGLPVAIGGDDFTISGGSPYNVRKQARNFAQPLVTQYGILYIELVEGVDHSSKSDEASGHMCLLPGDHIYWLRVSQLPENAPNKNPVWGVAHSSPI